MKRIYYYNATTKLFVSDGFLEPDDKGQYVMPSNSTDVAPKSGLHQPKWGGKAWIEGDAKAALALVKERKISELKAQYETEITKDVTYQGAPFQADERSQSSLDKVINRMGNGWKPPANFAWVDANNTPHPAGSVFLNGLANAIADRNAALFGRLTIAKGKVAAATTTAAINKVVL